MGDREFRNKIVWFSFAFSLLVIWIHSYNAELFLGKTPEMAVIYRLEHGIGDWLGQIAVPGFFMISGYLFFRNFSWERLPEKWKRRVGSVLLPYLLWNLIYYIGYAAGSRVPGVRDVIGKGVIPFSLADAVDAVIHYTYNYVFWYLFQLILLILLAPVLWLFLRCMAGRILLLAVLWVLACSDVRLPLVNVDALIYYASAGALAVARPGWVEENGGSDKNFRVCADNRIRLGFVLLIVAAFSYACGMRIYKPVCFIICRLLAVAGVWLLVPAAFLPDTPFFARYNFFLYATHFAFVRFFNKAGAMILPAVSAVPLVLFLMMPFLALAASLVAGAVLRRGVPVVWKVLNGGRS
ncbi:MAG: acyltransferase [Clostridiales bacterium]|nr:acyltransferase [Clostridiales bacterium]